MCVVAQTNPGSWFIIFTVPSQRWANISFWIYIVGYCIFIGGAAIAAYMLHVPPEWIGVSVLCLLGIAIVHGVTATRQKDTPDWGSQYLLPGRSQVATAVFLRAPTHRPWSATPVRSSLGVFKGCGRRCWRLFAGRIRTKLINWSKLYRESKRGGRPVCSKRLVFLQLTYPHQVYCCS